MRRAALLLSLGVALLAGGAGAQSISTAALPDPLPVQGASTATVAADAYRFQVDDTLRIFVWQQDDLTGEFTVQADGRILLPLIREVQAAGRTKEEVTREIVMRLSQYLKQPEVTVSVKRSGFSEIMLMGQVGRPGPKPFKTGLTLLVLLTESGGFGEDAVMTGVRLVRKTGVPGKVITKKINAKKILYKGHPDVALQPGDVIYVPTAALASFNKALSTILTPMALLIAVLAAVATLTRR